MAQWIRSWSHNQEVPSSNPLAAAIGPLGKALYPHCLVPWRGVKPSVPRLLTHNTSSLLSKWSAKYIQSNPTISGWSCLFYHNQTVISKLITIMSEVGTV